MGTIGSSLLWFNAIADGIDRFKPEICWFCHNLPVGSILPSEPDIRTLNIIDKNFTEVKVNGIIIDIDSGIFGVFSP